ncbi:MAG: ECF-type sigma factor [Pirellulaceae bacterium]
MTEITRILNQIEDGDPSAAEELLPLVYDELRRLAAQMLATENPGQSLDPTGLVHEAYLRLFGSNSHANSLDTRGHFLAAAAQGMRRILIDHARRRNSQKRGGGLKRQDMELAELTAPMPDDELLALHEALEQLGKLDPLKARLVELRYFGGLTGDEAARVLGISSATADRCWAYARAWLQTAVRDG